MQPMPPGPPAPAPAPPYSPVPPSPAPKKSGAKGCLVAALIVGFVLLAAIVVGGIKLAGYVNEQAATHIDRAVVGDCVRETPDDADSEVRVTPCGQAEATHEVLAIHDVLATDEHCLEVPGASSEVSRLGASLCLGEKGKDRARAANAAKAGDCLAVTGDDAETVPCTDPGANYKVLDRERDYVVIERPTSRCEDVPKAEREYTITWETEGGSTPSLGTETLSFCIAAHKPGR